MTRMFQGTRRLADKIPTFNQSTRVFEKSADVAGTRRLAQFAQRVGFNLANALARYREHLTDFFESPRITVFKPKTHADDSFLAGSEFP
jgi:hypothetical protein